MAIFPPNTNGPDLDVMIDNMLTTRDAAEEKDPLDPGPFPSLGFPNERRGSYFIQITNDDGTVMVTVWRSGDCFDVGYYTKRIYAGITQWGGDSTNKVRCEDLIQVQMTVHEIFTSGGNNRGVER